MKDVIFSCIDDSGYSITISTGDTEFFTWFEVVELFQQFLNSAGYIVPATEIDFSVVLREAWENRDV
jgi:hypothetical protein